jgi:hypothetical protein
MNQDLDINFIKNNMATSELISEIGLSVLKAGITTVMIIFAYINITNKWTSDPEFYAMILAAVISIVSAMGYYHNKIHSVLELFYTRAIDTEENFRTLGMIAAISAFCGVLIALIIFIFQGVLLNVTYCSIASSGFLLYVFRNKLFTIKDYITYILYGVLTGASGYGLGAAIVIAMGLIGFWETVAILTLETGFTAVYTYLGLLDWVNEKKENMKTRKELEAEREDREVYKEIMGRLAP